jgi:hypothetical protein
MDEPEGTPGSSTASTGRAVSEPARDLLMHPVQLDRSESHHVDECVPRAHEVHGEHEHVHADGCGHVAVPHDDHTDYVHDGHRHAEHDGHWDDH